MCRNTLRPESCVIALQQRAHACHPFVGTAPTLGQWRLNGLGAYHCRARQINGRIWR